MRLKLLAPLEKRTGHGFRGVCELWQLDSGLLFAALLAQGHPQWLWLGIRGGGVEEAAK